MYSTLSYLQRRANFRQLKADIPVTQTIPDVEDPAVFKGPFPSPPAPGGTDLANPAANCQELVDDFVKKAKQIEHLITILPDAPPAPRTDSSDDARPSGGSQEDEKEFEELEADLQLANKEYLEAVRTAGRSPPSVVSAQSAHGAGQRRCTSRCARRCGQCWMSGSRRWRRYRLESLHCKVCGSCENKAVLNRGRELGRVDESRGRRPFAPPLRLLDRTRPVR